jgi:hypothetical protein
MTETSIHNAKLEKESFNLFLRNIRFCKVYEDHIVSFFSELNILNKKINFIHLRLEEDGIHFWAMINNMASHLYQKELELKYITLIQKYIEKDSVTFLLSMNTENAATEYMKKNDYSYFLMDKTTFKGRELNAVIDLLLSSYCTGAFIGNVNPYTYCGSTFSYVILNQLRDRDIKKICIDIDHISEPEIII